MDTTPRRILIVRLSAIGDVVRALPALHALRTAHPHAHIAWLVEELSAPLLEQHPQLDAVYVWERRKIRASLKRPWRWGDAFRRLLALVMELRRRPYDLVIDFQGLLKSGVWTRASGAPRRLGFSRKDCRESLNALFTNERVTLPTPRQTRAERNLDLVAGLGATSATNSELVWREPPNAAAWADEIIQQSGGSPPVLLHPATSRQDKFWWPSCWGAVGDALREEWHAPIIITCGPGDRPHAEAVIEDMWGEAPTTADPPSLHHLVALIRRSKLFITVDNGPMHLAALTETPVLGLFGPRDVLINQPTTPHMRCVCEHGVFGPGDELPEDGGNMQGIRVADVLSAARALTT